jgi:hypothetical protein
MTVPTENNIGEACSVQLTDVPDVFVTSRALTSDCCFIDKYGLGRVLTL